MAQTTTAIITTHDDWFDCGCETEFQHRKGHTCSVCGASECEWTPDSRIDELIANGKITTAEAWRHVMTRVRQNERNCQPNRDAVEVIA